MSRSEIDELRERWEADRSPALTLELANAHAIEGESDRALEVLTAGLEQNPEHVATRVAKGRCHLELDQLDEAVGELAPVVIDDPAHLVANQLLAEAHARQGDLDRARDRLGLFELLGGGAEEVEALEAMLRDAAGREAEAPEAASVEETAGLDVAEPAPVAETAEPIPAAETAALDVAGAAQEDGDPFVLLDWIEFDESRYAAALLTEGIFGAAPDTRSTAGPAPEPQPVAEPVAAAATAADAAPTLTLGELYRQQGHHDEAVSIFRQILERQPGNVEAARALGELEKEGGWPLSAEDLLGGGESEGGSGASGELLRRYRDRLRGKE